MCNTAVLKRLISCLLHVLLKENAVKVEMQRKFFPFNDLWKYSLDMACRYSIVYCKSQNAEWRLCLALETLACRTGYCCEVAKTNLWIGILVYYEICVW